MDIVVDSASVGPANVGLHDDRVLLAAEHAGLHLLPRQARVFDEVNDIVNYDLVLVMDSFDAVEVLREVAVLDAIHRSGSYSTRVRQLASFVKSRKRVTASEVADWGSEIVDPLYPASHHSGASSSPSSEAEAMAFTIRHLQMACGGLLNFLYELHSRGSPGVSLRAALQQSLKCPLLDAMPGSLSSTSGPHVHPLHTAIIKEPRAVVRPYRGHAAAEVTIPHIRPRGYWKRLDNVQREILEWVYSNGEVGCMPTSRQLRGSGANSLQFAITAYHGGFGAVALSLGWRSHRAAKDLCWEDLALRLRSLMADTGQSPPSQSHPQAHRHSQRSDRATMPTQAEILASGGQQLLRAVKTHGGSCAVGELLHAKPCRPGLNTMAAISEQVTDVVTAANLAPGWLPSKAQLSDAGRGDVANAVIRFGGFRKVARQLGLSWQPRQTADTMFAYSAALDQVRVASAASAGGGARPPKQQQQQTRQGDEKVSPALSEAAVDMRMFMREQSLQHLPTRAQLQAAGLQDLNMKVVRSGGFRRLARLLNVPYIEGAGRPSKAFTWI